ncbi:MAG: hypothetical protein ACOY4H_07930 [Thermodesulfobacteriota bacterium]
MTTQLSFSKIENELLPEFRRKIGAAESTADVKKFFVYTMQELFRQVFAGQIEVGFDDIALLPNQAPPYSISATVQDHDSFSVIWASSDLPHVISRFTETALNRYRHLEKNPGRTEAKIRM